MQNRAKVLQKMHICKRIEQKVYFWVKVACIWAALSERTFEVGEHSEVGALEGTPVRSMRGRSPHMSVIERTYFRGGIAAGNVGALEVLQKMHICKRISTFFENE